MGWGVGRGRIPAFLSFKSMNSKNYATRKCGPTDQLKTWWVDRKRNSFQEKWYFYSPFSALYFLSKVKSGRQSSKTVVSSETDDPFTFGQNVVHKMVKDIFSKLKELVFLSIHYISHLRRTICDVWVVHIFESKEEEAHLGDFHIKYHAGVLFLQRYHVISQRC